jgi:hypothetical protein
MKVLAYYPYRKGYIRGKGVIHFPIELMRDFQHALAKLAGVNPDNHTCYLVQMDGYLDYEIRAFMFSDLNMTMGNTIDIEK